jgi:glycine/D-amino acid oxidase-like deaminating enzyme
MKALIVGGGVLGQTIAFYLLRSGASVHHIYPESGFDNCATLAAGAMLGVFAEVTRENTVGAGLHELEFRYQSNKIYSDFLSEVTETSSKKVEVRAGTFIIGNAFGRNDANNIQCIEEHLNRYKAPYQIVTERDVPGYDPNPRFAPHRILFLPSETFLNSEHLLRSLIAANTSSCNYTFTSGSVSKVLFENGKAMGVIADGIAHYADSVVIAAGVGTNPILTESLPNTRLPKLMPGKGTSLLLETQEEIPYVLRSPNRDFACGIHLIPRGDGTVYIGATNRTASCPGTSEGASVEELHDLLYEATHELNPRLDSAIVRSFRYGNRPISLDGYPVVGKTQIDRLYLATGTYRNGILMAPLIGRIISDLVYSGDSTINNPFCPLKREELFAEKKRSDLIKAGAEGIVSFLPAPHGLLPYRRPEELAECLETLMRLALHDDEKLRALREEIRSLIDSQPLPETFAQLFFKCSDAAESLRKQE